MIASPAVKLRATCVRTLIATLSLFLPHVESGARGITVNCVAPGLIDTDMVASAPQEWKDKKVANTPMGRIGEPEDVARCVVFLVAKEADFITGATLDVNGGVHMR